ncbi:outer membrane beta-barrel protein [Urechidicola vernalis]|uniref:Outer membrane beta-barrel protein n=1 Tax=Urechidicola vernalis TaxID=3075600 RepID=A0ABU2Y1N0_9FLAO|nr:outer membrane beta-barrel protein [Urechidicola sp. P050]MDT0551711.1 outer membrane beta-barrel protein [Urechidicola sp. P050]
MKRILILIFLTVFCMHNSFSQEEQTVTFSGKIVDTNTNLGLEYATVILNKNKSDVLFGCITDKNGEFKIDISTGEYTIKFEFLSYETKILKNIKITHDTSFGNTKLTPSTEALSEVEVSSESTKKTSIELGKKTYNVSKDIIAKGGTATDVLENAPSVSIENGVPTIRGNAATVLINGRISGLTKNEALQNLQASAIKKIEVITNPSSRYSANMSGGIINIILKKGLDNGWNGSITGSAGIEEIYGTGATLNYRKDKINFYTNTSYFSRRPKSKTTIENKYFENGITTGYLNEDRLNTRKNNVFNTTLGLDFYATDNAYFNIETVYGKYNGDFNSNNIGDYFDASNTLTSSIEQSLLTDHNDNIFDLSTTYYQYFEKNGAELYFNLTHNFDNEVNNSRLFFNELFPNEMPLPDKDELINDEVKFNLTRWQTYYTLSTSEKGTLEIGTDGELGNITSDFKNYIVKNGDFVNNPNRTNYLDYTENWIGFYADYIQNSDTFSFILGLRTEITDLDVNLVTTGERNTKNYTDIFPTIQLEYNLKEDKVLALNYLRSIKRVGYPDINPFEQRISETTSYVGNKDLLPFYPNQVEFTLLNKSEAKLTLNPTLYFRNYDNIWQNITVETGEIINGVPKLITTPINLGYLNFTGLELLTSYSPNDKLELSSTLDLNYVMQEGNYEYTDSNNEVVVLDYGNTNFGGSVDLNATLKLPLDLDFQTLIKYNLISEGAYSKRYDYVYMDAALSKDVFNKQASISINAKDIFNSNKTKRLRWNDDFNSMSNFQWREPSVVLNFTYRFNQSKKDRSIKINKKDEEIKY